MMQLQTHVEIPHAPFEIAPCARMLFVGSCFADNMGRRFAEDRFRVTANPYGVMYNAVSIGHTLCRVVDEAAPADDYSVAVLTLGTNHISLPNETGEGVDNCQKRPQRLFTEQQMTVAETVESLVSSILMLRERWPQLRVVLTVSPIRYRKYGYHGSQLSKATLLLAADEVTRRVPEVYYFPAYEIMNDELRDYRFYKEDMLHPTDQAVEYIWQRFADAYFGDDTWQYLREWQPVKEALGHRPLHPDSEAYRQFMDKTLSRARQLSKKYPNFALDIDIQ